VAVDMFVVATARFRLLYALIVLDQRPKEGHSFRCHPEPDASLARAANDRGLSLGHGTPISVAGSGSLIWPGFPRTHLYDGHHRSCYCSALALAERLRRTHRWLGPP
jgi:hypothetical protein